MSNERDGQLAELAGIYTDTLNRGHGIISRFEQGNRAAEKILAAGYRKPRVIETAADLDALPVGSVVLVDDRKCGDDCAWQLFDDVTELRDEFGDKARQAWGSAAYIHEMSSADLFNLGPATVLHVGGTRIQKAIDHEMGEQ